MHLSMTDCLRLWIEKTNMHIDHPFLESQKQSPPIFLIISRFIIVAPAKHFVQIIVTIGRWL